MRIVNREDFLKLPPGIVFSKYEPHIFEPTEIKCVSLESDNHFIDYIFQELVAPIDAENWEEKQTSFSLDFECTSRDGMFDPDQLFAVWEKEDVLGLIERLKIALRDGYK